MREFNDPVPGSVRAGGPSVVRAGPADAAVLVVLDPAGTGKHGELPATWRPLTEYLRVVWCRLPAADGPWREVEELLREFERHGHDMSVHLISSGPVAESVLDLANRHANLLSSVLLVDPETDVGTVPPGAERFARNAWDERTVALRRKLAAAGVQVRVVARSHGGPTDRVDPPLPLGHPDVVLAVVRELLAFGTGSSDQPDPARPSLLVDAVTAVWESLHHAFERIRHN